MMFLLFPNAVCNAKLDLAFIIDAAADVQRGFSYIRKFFLQLVDSFTISNQNVRVGLVVNSHRPQVKFSFGQFNSPNKIKRVLRLLQPLGKTRRTGMALMLAVKRLFPASKGKKTLIFLTAGKSSDPILKAVQKLVARGVDVFSVGVGPGSILSEVLTVGKDPQHAYKTEYSGLGSLVKRITDKACAGV